MPKYYFFSSRWLQRHPFLSKLGQALEGSLLTVFFWILEQLPFKAALALGRWAFGILGPRSDKHVTIMHNLALAFPELSRERRELLQRQTFRNLGEAMVELAHTPALLRDRGRRFEFEISPDLREALVNGDPAVFVSAHVGAWSLAALFPPLYGIPFTGIHSREYNQGVSRILEKYRRRSPVQYVDRDNSIRLLAKELAAGRSVGMLPDVHPRRGVRDLMLPWFGTEVATSTLPARLALLHGCPLIPFVVRRLPPDRYLFSVGPAIDPGSPKQNKRERARAMSAALNARFESWIRAMPEQWNCLSRR